MTDIATLKVVVKSDGTSTVVSELDQLGKKSDSAEKSVARLGTQSSTTATKIASLLSVTAVTSALVSVTKSAANFEKAMREVSTLTDSIDMTGLTGQVVELSAQFGVDKVEQAKAMYQVISAGASNAADATSILTAANKLAAGGVTDITTAADGLTSAINAYGASASDAGSFSDSMFVAMKAGKTTIGELSSSLGKVAPMASQAGMSFDELMAATSTLTTTGLGTSESMNALRQIMSGVLKPTSEASKAAERLGIDFSAAALESKGFAGFIQEIADKTGGSTDELSKLFGSVEALGAAMFLTSDTGGSKFNEVLDSMADKAGATDEAFDKTSTTTIFLADVLREQLLAKANQLGTFILNYFNPALAAVVTNFDSIVDVAGTLGQILMTGALVKGFVALPGLLSAASAGIAGVTAATKLLTLAMLANPLGALAVALVAIGSALVIFKDRLITVGDTTASVADWIGASWDVVSEKFATFFSNFGEYTSSLSTYFNVDLRRVLNGAKTAFSTLFDAVIGFAKTWANSLIGVFDGIGRSLGLLIGATKTSWENFWDYLIGLVQSGWDGIQAILNGDLSFASLKDHLEKGIKQPAEDLQESMAAVWRDVAATDYMGDIADGLGAVGDEIVALVDETNRETDSMATEVETNLDRVKDKSGETVRKLEDDAEATSDILDGMGIDWNALSDGVAGSNGSLTFMKYGLDSWINGVAGAPDINKDAADKISKDSDAMSENVRRGFERMRDSVGEFFQNTLLEGEASFSSLLNMFESVIAEMIATAASNRIVLSLGMGGASAGASASSLMSSGGGIGSTVSSIGSNLWSGIGNMGAGAMNAVGHGATWLGQAGIPGMDGLATSAYQQGMTMTPGMALGGMAAGFAGNWLGGKAFGETSGIGSSIGGMIGMATPLGPLGAAIGSFLGTGAEKLLGNIFGFGQNNGNNSGQATVDLSSGSVNASGVGKSFEQTNVDAAQGMGDWAAQLAQAIGGSTGSFNLELGNRRNEIDGVNLGSREAVFDEVFERVIEGASNMTDGLKDLVFGFNGSTEEAANLAVGLVEVTNGGKDLTDRSYEILNAFTGTADETLIMAQALSAAGEKADLLNDDMIQLIADFEGSGLATANFALALVDLAANGETLNPVLGGMIEKFPELAGLLIKVTDNGALLTDRMSALIDAFEGTNEQAQEYILALASIESNLNFDAVNQAVIDFAEAQNTASLTLTDNYNSHADALLGLINNYDGSLESTTNLALGLDESKKAAYALTYQLLEASSAIGDLTESSAESIRQSIMSEDELRAARKAELNSLVEELEVLSDPTAIKGTVAEIEKLNMQVFKSLGPEQQKAQAEAFAGFIEQVNEKAQDRLAQALTDLENSQMEINATLGDVLDSASGTISTASDVISTSSDTMSVASDTIGAAADLLNTSSATIDTASGVLEGAANSLDISSGVIDTASGVLNTASDTIDSASGTLDAVSKSMTDSSLKIDTASGVFSTSSDTLNTASNTLSTASDTLSTASGTIIAASGTLDAVAGSISSSSDAFGTASNTFDTAANTSKTASAVIENASGTINSASDSLSITAGNISNSAGIISIASMSMSTASNIMGNAANTMLNAAQAIPSTFDVNVSVSQTVTVKQEAATGNGYASGGVAHPGLAWVGEEGPELVRFGSPSRVFNAKDSAATNSGSGNSDLKAEISDLRKETRALAIMQKKQLNIWERVTRNGESLRTTAA